MCKIKRTLVLLMKEFYKRPFSKREADIWVPSSSAGQFIITQDYLCAGDFPAFGVLTIIIYKRVGKICFCSLAPRPSALAHITACLCGLCVHLCLQRNTSLNTVHGQCCISCCFASPARATGPMSQQSWQLPPSPTTVVHVEMVSEPSASRHTFVQCHRIPAPCHPAALSNRPSSAAKGLCPGGVSPSWSSRKGYSERLSADVAHLRMSIGAQRA